MKRFNTPGGSASISPDLLPVDLMLGRVPAPSLRLIVLETMMDLIQSNASLTMSSNEIAELTGKRHDHVLRDIEKMLVALEITVPKLGGSYQDSTGRSLPCFTPPKDLTFTLVLGYDVKRRYAVTRRGLELEEGRALPLGRPTPQF